SDQSERFETPGSDNRRHWHAPRPKWFEWYSRHRIARCPAGSGHRRTTWRRISNRLRPVINKWTYLLRSLPSDRNAIILFQRVGGKPSFNILFQKNGPPQGRAG